MGAASGVTWLTLAFFVPAVVVSLALLIWQLYARRGETLQPAPRKDLRSQERIVAEGST